MTLEPTAWNLGSAILFLEHHDEESMQEDIDWMIAMKTDLRCRGGAEECGRERVGLGVQPSCG